MENTSLDPVAHNRQAWDEYAAQGNEWSRPVTAEQVERARHGDWSVVLIGHEPVDRSWFPADLAGLDLLCLASGGGQQGPILSAAGARVTVFDNSPAQLALDAGVAQRDGLDLRTVQGDMRHLEVFDDASFDLVFHPVSNLFSPELSPVWQECFRVLRPGGTLLAGFLNPDIYLFDSVLMDRTGELVVKHKLPYSDVTHYTAEERAEHYGPTAALEYGHSMTQQIGGQLAAGFVLTGFAEAPHHSDATAAYMSGYFATRAVKPA